MLGQAEVRAHRDQPLGIRHGEERRHLDRRASRRNGPQRRRRQRRRARVRSLFFTAMTMAVPYHLKPTALNFLPTVPTANVSVSISNAVAVPPRHAYDGIIQEAAAIYGVDVDLIRSVMQTESAFDPSAVSPAGAQGLMQIMPALAEELGVLNPFNPRENIMAGTRYLRQLLDLHRGNIRLAVASYNAGAGAVAHYGRVPPFRETQDYVKRVTSLLSEARKDGAD